MRRLLVLLSFLLVLPLPLHAQDDASNLFQVMDVPVDVTSDSAANARNEAVIHAQRLAFDQLLARLGADKSLSSKLTSDAIAAFVQAFEVQQERASAVRYLGIFTVQFKPSSVRAYLTKNNVIFSEARSRPVLVLPVVKTPTRQILWEDNTKWRAAWEEAVHGSSLVPLTLPIGDLDDIALISADEAVVGKPAAVQSMIKKYSTSSLLVAVLKADPDQMDAKQATYNIEAIRFDTSGNKIGNAVILDPPMPQDAKAVKASLTESVKQIRTELENNWKQSTKSLQGPSTFLPVDVPVASIAQWSAIRNKLNEITAISAVNVLSMTRGNAHIELNFYGMPEDLKGALAQHSLVLEQSDISGGWMLRDDHDTP